MLRMIIERESFNHWQPVISQCNMFESLHLLSFIASPPAGESVRQPLALPVC